jgi:hypothetical protein
MFFSLRFYFYDTLDLFKVDFESWNGPNVTICNISFVFLCLPKSLIHSYLLVISILTFQHLHSHPLSLLLLDICSIPSSLRFTLTLPSCYLIFDICQRWQILLLTADTGLIVTMFYLARLRRYLGI